MLDQYAVSLALLVHVELAWGLSEFTDSLKELIILEISLDINGLDPAKFLKGSKFIDVPKVSKVAEPCRENEVSILLQGY